MSAMASQITTLTIVYWTVYERLKKASKLRVTGLCVGNSPVTTQRANNAENVSILRQHVIAWYDELSKYDLPGNPRGSAQVDCQLLITVTSEKKTCVFDLFIPKKFLCCFDSATVIWCNDKQKTEGTDDKLIWWYNIWLSVNLIKTGLQLPLWITVWCLWIRQNKRI